MTINKIGYLTIALSMLSALAGLSHERDPVPRISLKLRWRHEEHPSMVSEVFFGPDDRQAFSFSRNMPKGYTAVWDCQSGALVRKITSGDAHEFGMAASHDGRWLFQGGEHGEVYVHDLQDNSSPVRELKGSGEPVYALAATRDGRRIAGGGNDGRIRVWDLESGEIVFSQKAHAKYLVCLRFLPGEKELLSVGAETQADPSLKRGFEPSPFPSSAYMQAVRRQKSTAKIWDLEERRLLTCIASAEYAFISATLVDEGKRLLTGDWGKHIALWDLLTQKELRGWGTTEHSFSRMAIDPEEKILATTGSDPVQLWDVTTGGLLCTYQDPNFSAISVAFSRDGRMLLVGEFLSGAVSLFDIVRDEEE